ncbi:MAG: ComEC/Rec2 family competence protein [Rickettsiales bacterium]|jgi:competence protein ComEC|nr:ComEC/Rec2 family competence protein [Rickettsiales bacterium]
MFIPLFIALGVGFYFWLPIEPPLWIALCALFLSAPFPFIKRFARFRKVLAAVFLFSLGFAAACAKAAILDTKFPPAKIRDAVVSARVAAVERMSDGYRVRLEDLAGYPEFSAVRIRWDKSFGAPPVGARIRLKAALLPPFPPAAAGAFDFGRYSYFHGLSASGRAFERWEYDGPQPAPSLRSRFMGMRDRISARVLDVVPGPSGGVLVSMMTGDIYAVDRKVDESYKAAGISHMISISGFHMGVVAGLIFLLVRFVFALAPFCAHVDAKKVSAAASVFAMFFYMVLSGSRLPAVRSFIMTSMAMAAVMMDRNPLSMRFVSAAMAGMLLVWPEGLLNPGFQMSFMAIIVLIRIYDGRGRWMTKSRLANALVANALVSGLVGLSIMPFVVYSFNAVQPYGILGNLVALPLASAVVMPCIIASFLLMPLGLDGVFLRVAGLALDAIGVIAAKIAALPYASIPVHSMDTLQLLVILSGILMVLFWRKLVGIPVVAAGVALWLFSPVPDAFVDRYGTLWGVKSGSALLVSNLSRFRPDRITVESWAKKVGAMEVRETSRREFVINGRRFGLRRSPSRYGGEFYISKDGVRSARVEGWTGRRRWN